MDLYLQFIKFNSIVNVFSQFIISLRLFSLLFILFFLNFQNHLQINDLKLHHADCFLFVLRFFNFDKLNQIHLLKVFCRIFQATRQVFGSFIKVNFYQFFILHLFHLLKHPLQLILVLSHQLFPLLFHHLLIYFQTFLHFLNLSILLHPQNFQCPKFHFLNLSLQLNHQFQEITNCLPIFILSLFILD